ncbi:MAG TPA: ABC transporter substrate-binding protein [Candidatus Binatia bacterium]|nr:ABC transporter substrate-binding protein [Candidatus Binatia bacterium]
MLIYRFSMRPLAAVSTYLVLALIFTAVPSLSAYAQNLPLFRIANGTSGENPAVLWVGVDQGFYRKHGLNVEVIFMRSGPLAMSALASSDVQAVFTSSNNVLNVAAGGLDVVIIGNVVGRLEGDLMARPEIKKPDDLKGKQLAIQSIGGGGWAINMLALDYLGLDPDRDNIHFIVLGDQPSRIQALETGRAQASWMGSTFSAPLKKKGYTVLLEMTRATIAYLGASLVVRRSAVRQEPKLYEAMLKGTLDAMRFFMKPENKSASMKSIARVLRLQRLEDAENGYNAMVAAYNIDLRLKPEGVQKIYSILARTNPKLQAFKPETIIDDSLIQKIHASGY